MQRASAVAVLGLSLLLARPAWPGGCPGTQSEQEPNDTAATANTNLTLISEAFCAGDHSVNTDVDVYAVVVPAGQALRAEVVEGDRTVETCESNGIDSVLTLFAADGTTMLVTDDDDGRGGQGGWWIFVEVKDLRCAKAAGSKSACTTKARPREYRHSTRSSEGCR